MKLQLRLFVVMVLALCAVAGILVVQHQIDLGRTAAVLKSETTQRTTYFNSVLTADQQPLKTLSDDYSFWDDMVSFVTTHNLAFAQTNIDTSLSTFNTDAAWVYDLHDTLVYDSQADQEHPIAAPGVSTDYATKLKHDKFEHYYQIDGDSTIEVRAATIVPGDDPTHSKPAAGYWIVARRLSSDYFSQLETLSQSSDELLDPSAAAVSTSSDNSDITFTTPLNGWDGAPVKVLKTTYEVPLITDLDRSYTQQLLLVGIFGALLIIVAALVIWVWVLRPIRLISRSITTQRPELLAEPSHMRSELGRLASTVQTFFQQKTQIAEDAIRRSDLEALNKEKSAFLSVAAHELKGPISIVHMLATDLPDLAHMLTREQIKDRLSMINSQTDKMTTIINDLRSAGQSEQATKPVYRSEPVNFDEFLERELRANQLITQQTITFTGRTDKIVLADRTRLSQVIGNLLRNASKYSPTDSAIEVQSYADDTTLSLLVRDHGIGIASENISKVFDRFYRAPNAVNHSQGLGIGLSVCQQIISEMGGTISVQSELQKGSTFIVRLPIAK